MKPAILSFDLFLQFGGQGGIWLDELKNAWNGCPQAKPLITAITDVLTAEANSEEASSTGFVDMGIDVVSWIKEPSNRPIDAYLSSSVISQPAIFMTQISNLLTLEHNGIPRNELLRSLRGTTGHSQGIMASVLFSMDLPSDKFVAAARDIARWLFWQGIRMQQAFPEYDVSMELIKSSVDTGLGSPSSMAAVRGIDEKGLNSYLEHDSGITISLKNFYDRFVVSGPKEDLVRLGLELLKNKKIKFEFIQASAPFHSPYMKEAFRKTKEDLKRLGISFDAGRLKVPVFATDDGRNLQDSKDLTRDLLEMMHVRPVNWPLAVKGFVKDGVRSHVIDLGPGDVSARLTEMNVQGYGVNVVPLATSDGRRQLFTAEQADIKVQEPWTVFGPKRFVEFTGCQPVFGGGMTPTTAEPCLTVAAANAGFIVELAGGGQVTEDLFRKRMDKAVTGLEKGRGVIVNTLFLDPYLWKLHFDLIPRLKNEGYPIIGVTISAGVPEKEDAVHILDTFSKNGIWCNSFKVGTEEQIDKVLDIANSYFNNNLRTHAFTHSRTIILQIEGGKAGGHHSWEDLNEVLLKRYAKIRHSANIVLCVGGGVSGPEDVRRWFDGTWHGMEGLPKMPVDGVFVGTALMTAKEAMTSPDVKRVLVETEGTNKWIKKGGSLGGMTSLESSLGADIYYIDNAAAKASRLVDSLSDHPELVAQKKAELISALNMTAKPYFGDLGEMTYSEVLFRMKELMAPGNIAEHIPHDGDWYDVSYRTRYEAFEKRMKERFSDISAAETTLLHPEDVDYFIWLCKRPGKPVNFVPTLDENMRKWFRSDSLWQSHDPRFKADQVFIMPGPVAVSGLKEMNRPVADILKDLCGASFVDELRYKDDGSVDINSLYKELWGKKTSSHVSLTIRRGDIERYVAAIGDRAKVFTHGKSGRLQAPLNMTFVIAWEPISFVIWEELKDADLSKLVHLSNRIENVAGVLLQEGDAVECVSRLRGREISDVGTTISVVSDIMKDGVLCFVVESRFFIRGLKKDDPDRLAFPERKVKEVPLKSSKQLFVSERRAPVSNELYARVSGDLNPLHLDRTIAMSAGFRERIVHGMWTSAAVLSEITRHLSTDDPSKIRVWDVQFGSPLYSDDVLNISCEHVAHAGGSEVYGVKATAKDGLTIMSAKAYYKERNVAYMFTGQGSQEQMMGMDGYERSNAARSIWDEADLFTKNELGFSILRVVRENPKEMLVGKEKVYHPKGVLHLTQFTQVALTTLAMANVAELKESGAYVDDAVFCGHSLGEYAALSCSGIIPLKEVIRTVYHRGLTMQNFVPRNGTGESPYRMCVVRPNIVGMSHEDLDIMITDLARRERGSIEIVNYNIDGEQYSVTGEERILRLMEEELKGRERRLGATKPSVIFLEGIDVPFHSTVLRPGVDAFRKTLERTIPEELDSELLIKRYIPNLNAQPFELSKDYLEDVHTVTGSSVLKDVLQNNLSTYALKHSRTLLIELLAYQFASPVQWIKTQDHLVTMDRVIEIGSKPVLKNMLQRTVFKKGKYHERPKVLHVNELF